MWGEFLSGWFVGVVSILVLLCFYGIVYMLASDYVVPFLEELFK